MRFGMRNILLLGSILVSCLTFGFSLYIDKEVDAGKKKLESAETTLSQTEKLSSLNPFTKSIDDKIQQSAAPQLVQGREDIAKYTLISSILKGVSIFFLAIAGILLFLRFTKKR